MTFGETDRARRAAHQFVLLDEPATVEVPPFGAIEDEVESGLGSVPGLIGGAAEGFGREAGSRMARFHVVNQTLPELARDLICSIAAETIEPKVNQALDDF